MGCNSSFYSNIKKSKHSLNEKNVKIKKQAHTFKGFASAYNVWILNSFNPELQLKETGSAIESKLIDSLTQSKGFKFMAMVFLVFKKMFFFSWHCWCN